eukprot:TRINITY_DN7242_c0_g1_i1.p1 TRINITY_DN7242_c0_g1~~TRINITY_DN7242_c0_g1_i1.p1  ORF type:complete len:531 (+),score=170.10 TRINITY_DN7242_c0_g1_i1:85-1593(+)
MPAGAQRYVVNPGVGDDGDIDWGGDARPSSGLLDEEHPHAHRGRGASRLSNVSIASAGSRISHAVQSVRESLAEIPEHENKGTFAGTVFNILSNIVGGGVLALPYAFAHTGWALGCILVIYVGVLSGYAMWILMYCSDQLHQTGAKDAFSYKAMMIHAYGYRMGKAVEAVIVWYTFGTCVTYGVVTGHSLAPLARDWLGVSGFLGEKQAWTIFAGVLFAVCSCQRTLAELKFTSFLAFLTMVYVLVCVIVRFASPWAGRDHVDSSVKAFDWGTDIFKAIPLMSVSYGCHYNIPVFYQELKGRSPQRFKRVLYTALGIIMTTYVLMATIGYLHFGETVPSYILDTSSDSGNGSPVDNDSGSFRFSKGDDLVNVARFGMFIHFAFVFPLLAIACRRSVNLFLERDLATTSWGVLILQSLAIVALAVFLACLVPDIGVVLDFNGSLFGVFLIITFPGLLLIKMNRDFPEEDRVPVWPGYLLVVMGILFTVCGFVMTVIGVAKGDD